MDDPQLLASLKASFVRNSLCLLLRKHVQIHVHAPVPGMYGCVDGKTCLHSKWRRGPAVHCPLHGPGHKTSLHEKVCRQAVCTVYSMDDCAAVLPAFKMRGVGVTRRNNKPAKGPALEVDVVFVLRNSKALAVEVDGRSHRNKRARRKDAQKAVVLRRAGVKLFHIDLMADITQQFHEFRQLVEDML